MNKKEIISFLSSLSEYELNKILLSVKHNQKSEDSFIYKRRDLLNNKQANCPHCDSNKFSKNGKENNVQRYICKSCKKSFSEFTGTWLSGLHNKGLVEDYLQLMREERSLDYIKDRLNINKKTALDWRHKILEAMENIERSKFQGITESDETQFLLSEKGKKQKKRKPRKRGKKGSFPKKGSKQGIKKDEYVSVLCTADRLEQMDLSLASKGKIKTKDIEKIVENRVTDKTIICSDGSTAFKSFCKKKELEHHILRYSKGEYTKGKYHIQNVNSLHNKLKKWIDNKFWGVSTKYLQKYLNWFRIKQIINKNKVEFNYMIELSIRDIKAFERFHRNQQNYLELIST